MLLAEHHFPLQTHFLQKILRVHHKIGQPAPVGYLTTVKMMEEYKFQTNGSINTFSQP